MKFLGYILRNARRNPVRSLLTIGSIAVCGFLAMVLLSLFSTNTEVRSTLVPFNRVITMSAQGFTQPVPIALVREIPAIDDRSGIHAIVHRESDDKPLVSPFSWYGGKFRGESATFFAQFGVDPDTLFDIYPELTIAPDQLQAFKERPDGTVIGRKLAEDKKLSVGDSFELKGEIYPFDMNLTVVGIFDGPEKRDLRTCYFNWNFLNEGLKRDFQGQGANNSGTVLMRCKSDELVTKLCAAVDEDTKSSDRATKTQTEDAFVSQFSEMIKDLQTYINMVGLAVAFSLLVICGVAMAMSMRERTSEVAVLRAIGFQKGQILFMVLTEAVLIAGIGGFIGTFGTMLLFKFWDISPYTMGFFPFFYIPTTVAVTGFLVSLLVGLLSGLIPAFRASSLPVIDGLRKVV